MDRSAARTVHGRRRTAVRAAVGAGVLAAASCLVLAAVGDERGALVLASSATGSLGVLGGAATLTLGRDPGGRPRFRTAGGVAALLFGIGMLVNAVERSGGSAALLSVGDTVSLLGFVPGLMMVATLPRPAGSAASPARLLVDAAVVATAGALVLWRFALEVPGGVAGPTSAGTLVVVALELLCVGYLLGLVALGHDGYVVLLLLGVVALVVSNLFKAGVLGPADGGAAWLPLTVMCVGAPLLCSATMLMDPEPAPLASAAGSGAETRASLSTVMILSFAAVAAFTATAGGVIDPVSRNLLGLVVIAVLVREVLVQRQRVRDLEELRYVAEHDAFTGAGNRRALTRALSRLEAGPRVVIVLDLDGFTGVNARYGPGVGDGLLTAVVEALRSVEPEGARVFRLGADDFAVLASVSPAGAEALAQRVCTAVAGVPSRVLGAERLELHAHAGVDASDDAGCVDGADGADIDAWLPVARATQALVAAQQGGGPRVVVWGEELAQVQQRRSSLEERLHAALAERSLTIHLQPVVTLATGRLHGFEALSRWDDAVLGTVFPDEFVPVAEETGLVVDLGASVLGAALAALVRCDGVALALTMAVNASPVELRRIGYVESVAAALAEHGVPPDLLVVEVTEAVMVTPDDPAVASLHALAAMGVRIAVDDFGTGYSSLAYLTRLPVHVLKIDRSLTASLRDRATAAVVQAAAAMAAGMDLEVVAEGVEEPSQVVALAAMGIGAGQGWLWSKAVPEAAAVDMVLRGLALGPSHQEVARTCRLEPTVSDVAGA